MTTPTRCSGDPAPRSTSTTPPGRRDSPASRATRPGRGRWRDAEPDVQRRPLLRGSGAASPPCENPALRTRASSPRTASASSSKLRALVARRHQRLPGRLPVGGAGQRRLHSADPASRRQIRRLPGLISSGKSPGDSEFVDASRRRQGRLLHHRREPRCPRTPA